MDVGLPGEEPVGGERQLAFRGALARHFLVQAQQALIGQARFVLQHLQARTELNQGHRAFDVTGLVEDAFADGHEELQRKQNDSGWK
ncbi:hypothetical protein FQZ97_672090 [compost metagenome]